MIALALISFAIAGVLYYVFNLDFEVGTGFTEARKNMKEGEFRIVEEKEETKLIEDKIKP
jgi:hypothetical protein